MSNAAGGRFGRRRYGHQSQEYPPPNVCPPGPGPPYPSTLEPPSLRDEVYRSTSPRFGPGVQESQSYAQSPQHQPARAQALEVRPPGFTSPQGNLPPDYPQVYAQQGYQRYPPQGYYPQGYPPQGYYPQEYPPQVYYPDYPQQGYQGHPGYPPQGYYQQGYPPSQYAPGQQPSSVANTAFCASCIACITCLLCSCCQGLLGVSPEQDLPRDDYIPSDPVEVAPPTVSSGPD